MIKKQERWGKKVTYVRNWKKVNESYVKKAIFYLDFDGVKNWPNEIVEMNKGKRGALFQFPNSLIKLQAVWLNFFSYRGAEGITRQLVDLGLLPEFNDYSTIQRRVIDLALEIPKPNKKEFSATTDGSGVKMNMSGEYFEQMYGKGERKKFIKVVITAEPYDKDLLKIEVSVEGEGESEPTIAEKHMGELVKDGYKIKEFFGDGSFDKNELFDFCDQYGIDTKIKIRENAKPEESESWKRKVEA
ncbi:MAG: transposase [Nanoarchaeota archaeon]|nr:transposase [Nanoarchaeota archaeon]